MLSEKEKNKQEASIPLWKRTRTQGTEHYKKLKIGCMWGIFVLQQQFA